MTNLHVQDGTFNTVEGRKAGNRWMLCPTAEENVPTPSSPSTKVRRASLRALPSRLNHPLQAPPFKTIMLSILFQHVGPQKPTVFFPPLCNTQLVSFTHAILHRFPFHPCCKHPCVAVLLWKVVSAWFFQGGRATWTEVCFTLKRH